MSEPGGTTAVILAAGSGSRLRADGFEVPKPLVRLGGLSLLERTARTAVAAGADDLVIVLGCRGDEVRESLEEPLADLDPAWVHHEGWEEGNGSSLLAARSRVGEDPFLCLMSDHLLFPDLLRGLLEREPTDGAVMAVDRKADLLADLDDAMKVRLEDDRVVALGKELEAWDAVDTGASLCTTDVFDELEAAADGPGTLGHSDGMRGLADKGLLRAHDVGDARWEDADTAEDLAAARELLWESLRKETDGFMSRWLERDLSRSITRLLAPTGVTPNQVTLGVFGLGLLAGFLFSLPGWGVKVAAALVFWCASWTDGIDGELARLKFETSEWGGVLDFWCDNVVHMCAFCGMGIGLWRDTGSTLWPILGSVASFGVLLAAGWVYITMMRGQGGFRTVTGVPEEEGAGGLVRLLGRLADGMGRRDFIFFVIFIALAGWLPWFLWAAAVGTHAFFVVLVALHLARPND